MHWRKRDAWLGILGLFGALVLALAWLACVALGLYTLIHYIIKYW